MQEHETNLCEQKIARYLAKVNEVESIAQKAAAAHQHDLNMCESVAQSRINAEWAESNAKVKRAEELALAFPRENAESTTLIAILRSELASSNAGAKAAEESCQTAMLNYEKARIVFEKDQERITSLKAELALQPSSLETALAISMLEDQVKAISGEAEYYSSVEASAQIECITMQSEMSSWAEDWHNTQQKEDLTTAKGGLRPYHHRNLRPLRQPKSRRPWSPKPRSEPGRPGLRP